MHTHDDLRERCEAALHDEDQRRIAAALAQIGTTVGECVASVAAVTQEAGTRHHLQTIKAAVGRLGVPLEGGAFERFVLTAAAVSAWATLASFPISEAVKVLCRNAFAGFADPRRLYAVEQESFVAHCKIATLRRFPAGQFDWEPSGLPRSWVPKIRPIGALVRTLRLLATRMRGFGPMFFIHMGTSRKNFALLEREGERSYYRMATSMALQPAVKGLMVSSWLHSSDTFAVSPHLAWLNRVFLDNGAVVAIMGPADPQGGVLYRSPERQQAFDEGRFKPTLGLVIWPREEVLAWARRHPELDC